MIYLPAAPIVELLERMASDRGITYAAMAVELHIAPRTAYAWRAGESEIRLELADAVLTATPFNWHDVFDAEVTERIYA